MTEPIYLYGYGNRWHIQTPDKPSGYSFCDKTGPARYVTDEVMAEQIRNWAKNAELAIRSERELPVCKVCQKAWDRERVAP